MKVKVKCFSTLVKADVCDYHGAKEHDVAAGTTVKGLIDKLSLPSDEIKIMFEHECVDVYQPDATFAGGIAQVRRVIEACHRNDRLFTPHTWTNGIGFHVNWSLVLSDPQNRLPLEYPLEEPAWIPALRDGIIAPVVPDRNATLAPFTRPGLGFEIDR